MSSPESRDSLLKMPPCLGQLALPGWQDRFPETAFPGVPTALGGVPDGAIFVERNWTGHCLILHFAVLSDPASDSHASPWEFLRDRTETKS